MPKSNPHRVHDLNTVYLDFKIVLDLIKSGYRFDDNNTEAVVEQMNKALNLLREEIKNLEENSSSISPSAFV